MQTDHITRIIAALGILFWGISAHAAAPAISSPMEKDQPRRSAVAEDSVKWRRDPFGIAVTAKLEKPQAGKIPAVSIKLDRERQPDLNIQGIMQADKAFHALINGRVVKTGDKLDGVTIREISRYQVVVQGDNKEKSIYDIYQGRIDRGKNEK